ARPGRHPVLHPGQGHHQPLARQRIPRAPPYAHAFPDRHLTGKGRSTPQQNKSHPHPEVPKMFRSRRRAIAIPLLMVLPLVLAACSATGGKKAAEAAAGGGTAVAAGHANTKHYTIAMITHAAA